MEKQNKLSFEDEDLFYGKKPEVKVNTNTYMSAGALIREMIIRKTWVVPTQRVAS